MTLLSRVLAVARGERRAVMVRQASQSTTSVALVAGAMRGAGRGLRR
jgi:hypothetical protein